MVIIDEIDGASAGGSGDQVWPCKNEEITHVEVAIDVS